MTAWPLDARLEDIFPGDRVQKHAAPDDMLLPVLPPVLGHHHVLAARPHAVQKPVRAEFVLVVDALFLGLKNGHRRCCGGSEEAVCCRWNGPIGRWGYRVTKYAVCPPRSVGVSKLSTGRTSLIV